MMAINRLNVSPGFLSSLLACPAYPDFVIPLAATMAVVAIKEEGGRIGDAFRSQADGWMIAFPKVPQHLQDDVRGAMEIAWRDAGSSVPDDLFERSGPFAMRSFDDFMGQMRDRFPQFMKGPPN